MGILVVVFYIVEFLFGFVVNGIVVEISGGIILVVVVGILVDDGGIIIVVLVDCVEVFKI